MNRGFFSTNYTRPLLFMVLVLAMTRISEDVMAILFDPTTQRYQMIERSGHVMFQGVVSALAVAALMPLLLSTLVNFRTSRVRCFTRTAMMGLSSMVVMWLARVYLAQDMKFQLIDVRVLIDATTFIAVILCLGAMLNRHLMQVCGVAPRKIDLDEPNSRPAPLGAMPEFGNTRP